MIPESTNLVFFTLSVNFLSIYQLEIRLKSYRRASLSSWGVDAATGRTASSAYNINSLLVTAVDKLLIERFSIAFKANGKRQAEISRLPKTCEIYLVSAYILPVGHSYGASTKNREIS